MLHPARIVCTTVLLAALVAGPVAAEEAKNPLLPLTNIATSYNASMKAYLGGKDLDASFPSWLVGIQRGGSWVPYPKSAADGTRKALLGAKIKRIEFARMQLHVLFFKEKKPVCSVNFDLLVGEKSARIVEVDFDPFLFAAPAKDLHLIRTDAKAAAYGPVLQAGKALATALQGKGWTTLPVAKPADLVDWSRCSEADPKRVARHLAAVPKELEEAAAKLVKLAPDAFAFELQDSSAYMRGEKDVLIGALNARLRHSVKHPVIYDLQGTVNARQLDRE